MACESLEDHGIYVRREGTRASLDDCPQKVKDLFTLILSLQSVEWDFFGGMRGENCSIQATPRMQYESELRLEAEKLAKICLDRERPDDIEERLVQVLQPIVFYRFDREAEEAYDRTRHHHCFVCGKHFPFQSRPLLNHRNPRTLRFTDQVSEDADVCKIHLNISNFSIRKLTYLKHEVEGIKTPDLTIGLLAWSKNAWHPPLNMTEEKMDEILEHDLVKPFRHDNLDKLEKGGFLKPLFAYAKPKKGTRVERTSRSPLTFPFAIWEAKKASEGNPVAQNILKIKVILEWQRDVAKRANISWIPLVFHFVSVGSEWKLYACHVQPSTGNKKTEDTFLLRLLWSGDCANQTKALQLLCLVDIIALWGQFQYKPFAGACIRVLKKRNKGEEPWRFPETHLLEHQKPIDAEHFRTIQSYGGPTKIPTKSISMLQRAGTYTSEKEISKQLMQGTRSLSLEHYFIPERDGFIWLLHHKRRKGDHLVVRVNSGGWVLPPVVIFHKSKWESPQFARIIREEKARMPKNVMTEFRYDKDRTSFLRKCFDLTTGYCTVSDIQFCAIIPLEQGCINKGNTEAHRDLEPLEHLLDLQTLVDAAERAKKRWCSCNRPEEIGNMISCDATRCTVGWYHNKCVGLDEDYASQDWICRACKVSGNVFLSTYDSGKNDFDQETLDGSDARVQRARSLNRVWSNHKWPDPREVRDLMYRKICCNIQMDTAPQKFRDTIKCLKSNSDTPTTRQWAVLRKDPLQVTQIRQRFRASGDR